MAKVKLTKTELKAQTDALKRFQRFLPMLQLKKQQLQSEIAGIIAKAEAVSARERAVREQPCHVQRKTELAQNTQPQTCLYANGRQVTG